MSEMNIIFRTRTDGSVETMLRWMMWISERASGKTFLLKKIRISRVCVALKTIWSYCTLININCT